MAINNTVRVVRVFAGATFAKNAGVDAVVDVSALIGSTVGKFCYQYSCTSAGAAVVDITYTMSVDGVTYFAPGTTMVKEAITPASSTETGGAEYDFEFAPFLKFNVAETDNVAAVTNFDMWIAFG